MTEQPDTRDARDPQQVGLQLRRLRELEPEKPLHLLADLLEATVTTETGEG